MSTVKKHVAFILEPSYGHIIPTLGVAMELIARGHRVTYAVSAGYAPAIRRIGAVPIIYQPMEARSELCQQTWRANDTYNMSAFDPAVVTYMTGIRKRRTDSSILQLRENYSGDQVDLVVHDDVFDLAGRSLAVEWNIPKVLYCPAFDATNTGWLANDRAVIIPSPSFFQGGDELLDERFKFVGFIPEGRRGFMQPWEHEFSPESVILISASTGLTPQIDFFERAIAAFEGQRCRVILSLGSRLDPESEVSPDLLSRIPGNFSLNQSSANFDILKHVQLLICQGGHGSTMEAMYWGVPLLLLPPTTVHENIAERVCQLGLGVRLPFSASPAELRQAAARLMQDRAILDRVREVGVTMRQESGAKRAAEVIESYLGLSELT
jgi:UDP:flavonoid glycosyltransferase YjiC (YdhE family)